MSDKIYNKSYIERILVKMPRNFVLNQLKQYNIRRTFTFVRKAKEYNLITGANHKGVTYFTQI